MSAEITAAEFRLSSSRVIEAARISEGMPH
jgi:hypothetical protein